MSSNGILPFLVMLVDDNETDTFINKMTMELSGFTGEFTLHTNGKSAIEYLRQHFDTPHLLPDLIFLDLNMPIMNGLSIP